MRSTRSFLSLVILAQLASGCILRSRSENSSRNKNATTPRLVVLIVIDQMRADFIDRFSKAFLRNSANQKPEGLQYFYENGTSFLATRTASAPTVTATGHATVCSGTTASRHGIIANSYFHRESGTLVETAIDSSTELIRTPGSLPKDPLARVQLPGSSDAKMLTPNLADAIHGWSQGSSKTVSVSIKDRGAVYCGGKKPTGVYWYDYQSGSMVTSTRYASQLPTWVDEFNSNNKPDFNFVWKPNFPLDLYKTFLGDIKYQRALEIRSSLSQKYGEGFPYAHSSAEVGAIGARKFFEYTPYASDHLVDFALRAQEKEKLGCERTTNTSECSVPQFADLLTISFSTPDLVGHGFGPESIEHFDIYLNLNRSIERLRSALETRLGSGNILFVQTSDHGVQTMPEVSQRVVGTFAGRLSTQRMKQLLNSHIEKQYGSGQWIEEIVNAQIYFNQALATTKNLTTENFVRALRPHIKSVEGVRDIVSAAEIAKGGSSELELYKRGLMPSRSGDAFLLVAQGWLIEESVAGNHGTSNDDDTRIPLNFYGLNIPIQKLHSEARADDIAPTILSVLGAQIPNHMTGTKLNQHLSKL